MSDRKLIVFDNPEKKSHSCWKIGQNPANIPNPFRCLIIGKPNAGKTNMVKNLIIYQKPYFEKIYIIHPCSEPQEYEDIEYEYLESLPTAEVFDRDTKNLLIIDDKAILRPYEGVSTREHKKMIDELFSYTSTHHNVSIIITVKNPFSQLCTELPSFCNVFIIFKIRDRKNWFHVCSKLGIPYQLFKGVFDDFNDHDSICFDQTINTPYPVRKNLFKMMVNKDL